MHRASAANTPLCQKMLSRASPSVVGTAALRNELSRFSQARFIDSGNSGELGDDEVDVGGGSKLLN